MSDEMHLYAIEVTELDNSGNPVSHVSPVYFVTERSADSAVEWLHQNSFASARTILADVYMIVGTTPIQTRSDKHTKYTASRRAVDEET